MALRADDVDLGRDRALVEQHQDGDIAAFEDLYRRYYGRLFRFCLRRTGDPHEAEEVAQEAFARAYRAMPTLRGERRFYPWLSVIASRLCIDAHRRIDRTAPSAEVDPGAFDAGDDPIEVAVDHELLLQALDRLSERHREVLHLREQRGWSYQRIAEHYSISMGAVEGLLFRARQSLRREFLGLAGPDAGLAGGVPLTVGGLGWLGRRLTRLRLRASEWAGTWANVSALAANGLGVAMVVTTAAGLATAAVTGSAGANRPVAVLAAEPIAAGSAVAGATVEQAATPPAAAAPAGVAHAKPAAPAGGGKQVTASVGDVRVDPKAEVWLGQSGARDRAEENSVSGGAGPVAAGVDPQAAAVDTATHIPEYVATVPAWATEEDPK